MKDKETVICSTCSTTFETKIKPLILEMLFKYVLFILQVHQGEDSEYCQELVLPQESTIYVIH